MIITRFPWNSGSFSWQDLLGKFAEMKHLSIQIPCLELVLATGLEDGQDGFQDYEKCTKPSCVSWHPVSSSSSELIAMLFW